MQNPGAFANDAPCRAGYRRRFSTFIFPLFNFAV
jgi:hypothetical protein